MGEGKQRLRPWLEAQINSRDIPGLYWLNEEKTKFRIPWKHGGKQDWNPESGQIFKEWARHTGRFREGIDDPDYVKWKTRLRCAFNKAPDIEEVKEESQLEGPDPFRVYNLKPRKSSRKNAESENKSTVQPSFVDIEQLSRCQNRYVASAAAAPIPTFVNDQTAMSVDSMPSDLRSLKLNEIMNFSMTNDMDINMLSGQMQSLEINKHKPAADMILKLFYSGVEVMEKSIESLDGCRLYYNTFSQSTIVTDLPEWMIKCAYCSPGVDCVMMPPCDGLMDNKLKMFWQQILERGLTGGVALKSHDDDIYALRFCSCSVFYATYWGTGGNPTALDRNKENDIMCSSTSLTKIFDYQNGFLPALENYCKGKALKPDPSVYLFFGMKKEIDQVLSRENSVKCIYATITSTKALKALSELDENQISSDEKLVECLLKYHEPKTERQDDELQDGNGSFEPHLFSTEENVMSGLDFVGDDSTLDFNLLAELGLESFDGNLFNQ